jgi:hypothetical protein
VKFWALGVRFRIVLACLGASAASSLAACSDAPAPSVATKHAAPRNTSAGHDASTPRPKDSGASDGDSEPDVKSEAGRDAASNAPVAAIDSGACAGVVDGELPDDLSCAGLYADITTKDVAAGVSAYDPARQLWADGATKQRWIYLPPGTKIDNSDPDEWRFPVGTKLFKEFSWKGHRVETRIFWKAAEGRWLKAPYQWNAQETAATRFAGGPVDVAGDTYYIPTPNDCDQCHKGRDDRALGFEQLLLGLPEAQGLTLSELVAQGLLLHDPGATELAIGDDGTGHGTDALAWLHVNCGVSCHSANTNSEAYKTHMFLRVAAADADGRSSAGFDTISTTVGVATRTPRWLGHMRVVAGSPEQSFLYTLISKRDPMNPKDQMPPIASRVVDDQGTKLMDAWIRSLPHP